MIEQLNQLDHELMLWLNYDGGGFQDRFWYALTDILSWIPFFIIILYMFHYCSGHEGSSNRKQYLLILGITVLVILATDQISASIIKPWIQRPRPSHQEGIMEQLHFVNDYLGGAYGFVSSHAANTFGVAIWVSMLFRNRGVKVVMILYALLNCYSRIYLGVHYPGDILCGSLLGILCGILGYGGYRLGCRKWGFSHHLDDQDNAILIGFCLTIFVLLLYAVLM